MFIKIQIRTRKLTRGVNDVYSAQDNRRKLQTDLVVKKFIGLDPVMSQVYVGK